MVKSDCDDCENPAVVERNKSLLRQILAAVLTAPPEQVSVAVEKLVASAKTAGAGFFDGGVPSNFTRELADLIVQLHQQHPGDVGIFMVYFLNHVKLKPGEAIYMEPGDVHAYVSGGKAVPRFLQSLEWPRDSLILCTVQI
jgi:mannose-6-phosphate isomerase